MTIRLQYIYLVSIAALFLASCSGTRYLQPGEQVLVSQKIKGTQKISKFRLEEFYAQKPNKRFPIPYAWLYEKGKKNYDIEKVERQKEKIVLKFNEKIESTESESKKLKYARKRDKKIAKKDLVITDGNLLMRWGEPLAVFDSAASEETERRINLYLTSKGFFKASSSKDIVHPAGIKSRKKIRVNYNFDIGTQYLIDTFFISTKDEHLLELLNKRASKVAIGAPYDQDVLTQERDDIDLFLKNKGYYDFSKNFIHYDIDTAYNPQRVGIRMSIFNRGGRTLHKTFTIDSVIFTTDADIKGLKTNRKHIYKDGITYSYYDKQYKLKALQSRIFIYKDSLYNRKNTLTMQRQLASLDMFKFINITYDTTGGDFIANIFTSPLKRYSWTNEFGVSITQGLPGPFVNTSFKKRNLFGGLESLEFSARFGFEGVAPLTEVDNVYQSTEAGANVSLTFPKFIIPFSKKIKVRDFQLNPRTKMEAGYSFQDRPEYKRNTFNVNNAFLWEKDNRVFYRFVVTDINFIQSDLDQAFEKRLKELEEQGNLLINTFKPSFVTSMIFDATYNFNQYGRNNQKSSFLRLTGESGGTTQNLVEFKFAERHGLETYKYLKVNGDYRQVIPITRNSSVAFRLNGGIAVPYSEKKVLPYEKYLFAGGSNGIRAWRPRRLGPGSYTPLDSAGNLSYQFEQQGEILLEASLELRKKLIGFIDGAAFIDAGNIWLLEESVNREGGNFAFNRFYKELAVSGGVGLRFDFTFLILRFDLAAKLYDPARPEGKRFILNQGHNDAPFDNRNARETFLLNFGIGYSF